LYEAIQRLEEGRLIAEADQRSDPADGQEAQRRYYTLTARGLATLRVELRRLGRLVDDARTNRKLGKGIA
jgi:DNA-binding PadR family transcriptional regulator